MLVIPRRAALVVISSCFSALAKKEVKKGVGEEAAQGFKGAETTK